MIANDINRKFFFMSSRYFSKDSFINNNYKSPELMVIYVQVLHKYYIISLPNLMLVCYFCVFFHAIKLRYNAELSDMLRKPRDLMISIDMQSVGTKNI